MNAAEVTKSYASESAHWYTAEGLTCHEQPCKSRPGEFRPTTLRDARVQGLYPSVSGILKVMDQPGLKRWRDRQIAGASYGVDRSASFEDYCDRVLESAETEMSRARDKGSEVHGAIEKYFRDLQVNQLYSNRPYSEHIKAAIHALDELGVVGLPFRPERSFTSPMYGYGGCTDYVTESGSEDIVVDFKIVTTLEKKMDYWDRCAQISAYQVISPSVTRGANVFIDSSTAEYLVREWSGEELAYGWELFQACSALWRIINRYDPRLKNSGA